MVRKCIDSRSLDFQFHTVYILALFSPFISSCPKSLSQILAADSPNNTHRHSILAPNPILPSLKSLSLFLLMQQTNGDDKAERRLTAVANDQIRDEPLCATETNGTTNSCSDKDERRLWLANRDEPTLFGILGPQHSLFAKCNIYCSFLFFFFSKTDPPNSKPHRNRIIQVTEIRFSHVSVRVSVLDF